MHTKMEDHFKQPLKYENTNQLILFDLSKAFGEINRDILWTVLYGRSLPSNLIKIITMGHQGTKLMPRNNGIIGGKVINNIGAFRGSPLCAFLFIIYAEGVMGGYNNSLKHETIQNMHNVILGNEEAGRKWANYLHMERYRKKATGI